MMSWTVGKAKRIQREHRDTPRQLDDGSMCRSGKVIYRSKRQALNHRNGSARYAYRCPWCDHWHLTKQPQRQAA